MSLKEKQAKEDEKELPAFCEGESFEGFSIKVTEHDTLPPKAYTESTLLSSMERAGNKETTEDAERKGLGTPATRASIIEKIINDKFSDDPQGKSDLYSQLLKAPSGEDSFDQAIQVLSEHYVLQGSGTAE